MRVEAQIDVSAPCQLVWDYITDPSNSLHFMAGMTRWEVVGDQDRGLGARYRMLMRVGSAEIGGLVEVVECDEPSDLHQPADLGRAHAHEHPVAGADARGTLGLDLPAGHAGHEVQVPSGVVDERPHLVRGRGDLDRRGDPHPITGRRRSEASASRVSCMRRRTCS